MRAFVHSNPPMSGQSWCKSYQHPWPCFFSQIPASLLTNHLPETHKSTDTSPFTTPSFILSWLSADLQLGRHSITGLTRDSGSQSISIRLFALRITDLVRSISYLEPPHKSAGRRQSMPHWQPSTADRGKDLLGGAAPNVFLPRRSSQSQANRGPPPNQTPLSRYPSLSGQTGALSSDTRDTPLGVRFSSHRTHHPSLLTGHTNGSVHALAHH